MLAMVAVLAGLASGRARAAPPGAPGQSPQQEVEGSALTPEQARLRDLSMIQNYVMTLGTVDGAPLRSYHDSGRKTTCYFWKASLSCVKD